MFPGLNLCYTDPLHLITAGQDPDDLDYVDHDLDRDLDRDKSDACFITINNRNSVQDKTIECVSQSFSDSLHSANAILILL